jgi:dipeptidyl aminopeptidase/acylaminoacyl peptidase
VVRRSGAADRDGTQVIRAAFAFAAALALGAAPASAALTPGYVTPPESLVLDGVPPIAAEIAEQVRPYGEFRPHGLWSWHPTERQVLVRRRLEATNQVHRVVEPGTTPQPLTDFPNAVFAASFQPTHGRYFVFLMGEGGDEVYRIHRYDFATQASVPVSPAGERVASFAWSRGGDRIVYATVPVDRNNPGRMARTSVHLVDPARPETDRVVARFEGGGWTGFRFSEDGKRMAYVEVVSSSQSHLWVMDLSNGKRRRVTRPGTGEPVAYRHPRFTKDARALLATSDRDNEFQRLVLVPLAGGPERVLSAHLRFDVDDLEVSHDAGLAAFVTNENGSHVLRFLDLVTLKEQPRPPLVDGVIGGLEWRPKSREIGFHITSARSAGDVFSYDAKSNQLTRWTNGNNPEVNTRSLAEPSVVRWKSFDGLELTGLLYRPPASFTGKRPVVVNVHGGPASQARPVFLGRNNHLINALGVAMVYPNVRGSSGFGKTFLKLDDARGREDSVRDLGALLDWIATQPGLDASKVLVMGGSYGGYMSLAASVRYADRIAGAISTVGISNFVTFLERTESYRRDLRRAEYGDERDPDMRAFLESIAPLNQAAKISKPLLVAQGYNDPRVPRTESDQIVAALKRQGTPVWYVLARDEGHGFAKKHNIDFLFYVTVEFAKRVLGD